MTSFKTFAIVTALTAGLGAAAWAQTSASQAATHSGQAHAMGQGMHRGQGHAMNHEMGRGPVGMLTQQDSQSAADMGVAMDLVHANTQIQRTVTNLPNGIKTVTESGDAKLAQGIKTHVVSMLARLDSGREFNIFSTTLPVVFDKAKKVHSAAEFTDRGVVLTQTSSDPQVVAALQAHAAEVSELVTDGPAAFHRGIDARMAMGPGGPRNPRR
jgi:hypothetical protein